MPRGGPATAAVAVAVAVAVGVAAVAVAVGGSHPAHAAATLDPSTIAVIATVIDERSGALPLLVTALFLRSSLIST
jgi:hypothetical protein